VDNLDALSLANQKCNAYGLDTISTGVTIAFAMEASGKGMIDEAIPWGDADELLRLIDEIAYTKGLGKELARGIDTLGQEWGVDFAMHIKGQEIPMHDPRGKVGLGLSYATSPRGATHLEAFHDTMMSKAALPIEELRIFEAGERFDWEGKPHLCKTFEDLMSFANSLVMCSYISFDKSTGRFYPWKRIRDALAAMTGREISAREMLEIGERNYVLRKVLAVREGYTRADDELPRRLKEPLPDGASAGRPIEDRELQAQINEYYALRGFDHWGPTPRRLERLGLEGILCYLPEREEARPP
jgi:aldehyde:ferredoxin oxidoreductase